MNKRQNRSVLAGALQVSASMILIAIFVIVLTTSFGATRNPVRTSRPQEMSLTDRVAYQYAIEEVYWRHRIWPKENGRPKPELADVISLAQVQQKVGSALRNSQLLTQNGRAITPEQLQNEMERVANNTRQPDLLRELFTALNSDPALIAECLVRPVLADRLVQDLAISQNDSFEMKVAVPKSKDEPKPTYTLPEIVSGSCADDTWTAMTTTNVPIPGTQPVIWTGSEMIVWGGQGGPGNTGGRYSPSTDSWVATSTANAAEPRYNHSAIWTGTEMIIWGGENYMTVLNSGGRYNPISDSWVGMTVANAPQARYYHTALWTGNEMIVWGGYRTPGSLNTGGRYNPSTDSWVSTTTANAPTARYDHTAVWTGNQMLIWGPANTGARYNPSTNSWVAISTNNAPSARDWHTAIWTGSEMIIWGGAVNPGFTNTGGRYNPITNNWVATTTVNAPDHRSAHSAVWTGSEMIIWGGIRTYTGDQFDSGGRYNPSIDYWANLTTNNAPSARSFHSAVWTGNEMIVWGGGNNGGIYCAQVPPPPTPTPCSPPCPTPAPSASPSPVTPTPSPSPRVIISGTISYCSNPVPPPVSNVTVTLTGSASGSMLSNGSGNYTFSVPINGSYTVTPTKNAVAPASDGITTVDVIAIQRHFLGVTLLSGCRLTAADVNGDSVVTTVDVIAVQRFFLGLTTGTANVGKYQFSPVNRSYSSISGDRANQNYDTVIFGDVANPFVIP